MLKRDYSKILEELQEKRKKLEEELSFLETLITNIKKELENKPDNSELLKEYRNLHKEYRTTITAIAELQKLIQKYQDTQSETININIDNVLSK